MSWTIRNSSYIERKTFVKITEKGGLFGRSTQCSIDKIFSWISQDDKMNKEQFIEIYKKDLVSGDFRKTTCSEKTSIVFPFKFFKADSFLFDFESNGIPFDSKSKGNLSPRSYPIQFQRKCNTSFLSVPREKCWS